MTKKLLSFLSHIKKWFIHIAHCIKSTMFTNCLPRNLQKDYFPVERQSERSLITPVVLCMWSRIENLPRIIHSLNKQEVVNIELFIWNNNQDYKDQFCKLIKSAKPNFSITVTHSDINTGGFGRFYLAKDLASKYPYIITIDDDQSINSDFIKTLTEEAKSKHILSAWAFNFFDNADYWSKTLTAEKNIADYCGTGGAIFDSAIFEDTELFNCPKRYWFIEDLWISFLAKKKGWVLKRSTAKMELIDDGKDQHSKIYNLKNFFLDYLRKLDDTVYPKNNTRAS